MALQIQDKIVQTFAQPNIADIYGTYPSTSVADIAVTAANVKCAGLTVGIKDATTGVVTEYWYQPDGQGGLELVEKNTGGTVILPAGSLFGGVVYPQSIIGNNNVSDSDHEYFYLAYSSGTYQPFNVTIPATNHLINIIRWNSVQGWAFIPTTYTYEQIDALIQAIPAGVGIASITKIDTSGLVDTYRIVFTDNTTTTFQVTNGADGQDAVNPFKGWWPDLATLKAAHTATPGDSAYVKDVAPATTWSIYVYDSTASSDNYWADSGTDADTTEVQTFASGQRVNQCRIADRFHGFGDNDVLGMGQAKRSICTVLNQSNCYLMQAGALTSGNDAGKLKTSVRTLTCFSTFLYEEVDMVTVSDGYRIAIVFYDDNYDYLSYTNYTTQFVNDHSNVSCKYIRICVQKADGTSSISTSEATGINVTLNVKTPTLNDYEVDDVKLGELFVNGNKVAQCMGDYIIEPQNTSNQSKGLCYINVGAIIRQFDEEEKLSCNKCFGNTSQQAYSKIDLVEGHKYFIASMVKVDSCRSNVSSTPSNYNFLERQNAGTVLGVESNSNQIAGISGGDKEWHYVNRVVEATSTGERYFYFGTQLTADIDAYVTNVVCIDLTAIFGSAIPSRKSLLDAYHKFCATVSLKNYKDKMFCLSQKQGFETCEVEEKLAFVEAMNAMSKTVGLTNSRFDNPGGTPSDYHYMSASDLARLTALASENKVVSLAWCKPSLEVSILGDNARTISAHSTYKDIANTAELEADYIILGGKTGTWSQGSTYVTRNVAMVVQSKVDGAILVGCIMKSAISNRFVPLKELFDWLEAYRVNPNVETPTLQCDYAAAFVLPKADVTNYSDRELSVVYKNKNAQWYPASTTKIMTSIVASEFGFSSNDKIRINGGDLMPGSGYEEGEYIRVYDGDIISFSDMMAFYMLVSNNSLSSTIARVCGKRILERAFNGD